MRVNIVNLIIFTYLTVLIVQRDNKKLSGNSVVQCIFLVNPIAILRDSHISHCTRRND